MIGARERKTMGRETRMVPPDWVHPDRKSLFDGSRLAHDTEEWDENEALWSKGEFPDYVCAESQKLSYAEWAGDRPDPDDYMPVWTKAEATHIMMYETCSEGSPVSPAFEDPNELARWLANNQASTFANFTTDLAGWEKVIAGSSPHLEMSAAGLCVRIL